MKPFINQRWVFNCKCGFQKKQKGNEVLTSDMMDHECKDERMTNKTLLAVALLLLTGCSAGAIEGRDVCTATSEDGKRKLFYCNELICQEYDEDGNCNRAIFQRSDNE